MSITPAKIERIITKAARDVTRNALLVIGIAPLNDDDNNNTNALNPDKLKLRITIPDNSIVASLQIYTKKGAYIHELIN